jgi:CheY-specific phosphatase CheX
MTDTASDGKSPLDPIIPKSLIESLKETFSIQASTTIEILKVCAVEPVHSSSADLIAAIGMKSSTVSGTLAICFPKSSFLGMVNKMLGEGFSEITVENSDAAGEFLNIIYASARVKMNQAGHDFAPAIPTVTRGSDVKISHGGVPKIVKVDCRCEHGEFHLEVSLRMVGR